MNHPLLEIKWSVVENDLMNLEASYKFECFEKDPELGWLTLICVFFRPGFSLWLNFAIMNRSAFQKFPNRIHIALDFFWFVLIPFFPLQVIIIKLLAALTSGPELQKICNFLTKTEVGYETEYQCIIQLWIIFIRHRLLYTWPGQLMRLFGNLKPLVMSKKILVKS